jgi:hypothetical protein
LSLQPTGGNCLQLLLVVFGLGDNFTSATHPNPFLGSLETTEKQVERRKTTFWFLAF